MTQKVFGPRERLILKGPQSLTTQELFMVLLCSGIQKHPVERISKKVEALIHSILPSNLSIDTLCKIPGIGKTKACILLAAVELSQRLNQEHSLRFTSPNMVSAYLYELQDTTKEIVVCLYLSARYMLIHKEILAVGSLNQTIISPREVFSHVQTNPIAFIILAHNHPSGDPTPSEEDKAFTMRIREAGNIIGISLLDHIIIAQTHIYSMKEHGYL